MGHSSTFNSDANAEVINRPICSGAPFALMIAVSLVAGAEIVLRLIGPESLVAYEQGVPSRYAARHHILALGTDDICFIGSSRTNNGINCPTVSSTLLETVGRKFRVANCASGGAQTPELVPLVRFMLRYSNPELILFGVEPEQLGTKDVVNERSAIFWNLRDFGAAREQFGSRVDSYLPQVIRNEIELQYFTLRARGRSGNLLRELFSGFTVPHPLRGEVLFPAHVIEADLTLQDAKIDPEQVRKHVLSDHLVDGHYPFSADRIALLHELIDLCRGSRVPLVFFEVPDAAVFSQCFPPGTHERFVDVFRQLASTAPGVQFFTLDDLELEFSDADFRDPVHLNLTGAKRLSRSVTERIIKPVLDESVNGEPSEFPGSGVAPTRATKPQR